MEVVTGAIGSLLPKLGELLKEEYKLQKGAKKDVQSLTREVVSMQAALGKVGQIPREQLDEQVKLWAGEVRELSYVMEDTIDTFLVRVEGSEPEVNSDGSAFGALMKKMVKLFDKGKTRHQIADAIKDIKDRVQEVAQRRSNYKIDDIVASPPSSTTIDPRLSALYNKITDLVGIDEPREELIKRLAEGGDAIKVVSLAGFGGLGKTTLAKAVYESLRAQFDCAAFVSVSQNPDITRVFKKMLHQLDHKKYAHINEASWDETQLIDELREFLRTKRYVIVIDDIWNIQPWEIIRYALVENNSASRIITTTRDFDIAERVGGCYNLKPLVLESSKILFYRRIFGSEEKCPEHLAEISMKILKKCGGVPLAIITMASLLSVPSKMVNPSEWYEDYHSIGSGLGDSPSVKNMRMILSLSYYSLPSHLRTCLLYLSVFPEDYEIPRDKLIWKWISEGFIHHKNPEDRLFEVGERYFIELINRGLIQPCFGNQDIMITHCRLHDMVLDHLFLIK
ncbi:hypothetical protein CFC21_045356 [Triticum aestivum]|uniref:AAA+ ATPase domain-containing protein n=2 Tax=Triticum aestivum TaxID=4565 RepID=A0A9R1FSR8_WHEAT|nr:hypothetical protein CFC21_045356 [Triticum aestivum]